MMNEEREQEAGVWGSQRPALLLLSLGATLSACTLTSDSFEPVLVWENDAGAAPDGPSAPVDEAEASAGRGCVSQGADGVRLDDDDPSCSSAVSLLPGEGRSGPDAGAVVEPVAPIAPPPCEGQLGAFEPPEPVAGLDFDENVFGPALSADGRTLYFSAYVSGEQQIFLASRSERGRRFEDVRELPAVNSPASDGSPFLSANGERLYLFSERDGGLGDRDIWMSQRQNRVERFGEPQPLAGINSGGTDLLPWLSTDELTLLFVSNRAGGRGGADVWMAQRGSVDQAFEEPSNLAELSSEENEGRAVLSADGLSAFFSSDRAGGRGGPDLWMAMRAQRQQPFVVLINLTPLNSPANDQDVALSSDGTELFFASSRSGVSELWRAQRSCQ